MNDCTVPGGRSPRRAWRRWWPDGNPLRRGVDRAEAIVVAAVIAIFAAGAPASAVVAGHWAYQAGVHGQKVERAYWRRVPAVLLTAPGAALPAYGGIGLPEARARWRDAGGVVHRGDIVVLPGSRRGHVVMLWVNRAGQLVSAPLRPQQVTGQVVLACILAPACLALLLLGGWLVARRLLDRRRLAAWEAAWRSTGPAWSRPS